jgi:hypothetical protein
MTAIVSANDQQTRTDGEPNERNERIFEANMINVHIGSGFNDTSHRRMGIHKLCQGFVRVRLA